MEMVGKIYSMTRLFPREEIYGLTNQMRRAAVSVPSNIAEGAARQSKKEFIQFLHISLGSLSELETQLLIADNLKYLQNIDNILSELEIIRRLAKGLINYLENK